MTFARDALRREMKRLKWSIWTTAGELTACLVHHPLPPNKISQETIRAYRYGWRNMNPTFFEHALATCNGNENVRALCEAVLDGIAQDNALSLPVGEVALDTQPSSPAAPDDEPDSTM